MRIQLLRGNTAKNNQLVLSPGELSVDTERNTLRLHDGVTLGGVEVNTRLLAPGPAALANGDGTTGFFGEVAGADMITYGALATEVGIVEGTLQHDAESAWLKFVKDGEILFVAKKPIHNSVSWDALAAAGAVLNDGSAPIVTIDGYQFRVTLLTGGDGDPAAASGGEWNRLMYPVHVDDPTGLGWGVGYTNADLIVGSGDGGASWTQEVSDLDAGQRILRGGTTDVTDFNADISSATDLAYGWRPCLRLV